MKKLKNKWFMAGLAAAVILIIIIIIVIVVSKEEDVSYKEAVAVIGDLSAGVTETGSVDVGTTVQSFDLDISEFTGDTSFSMGGYGMDMMMGMQMQNSNSSSSSSSRQLEIEEVYVEAGQEIEAGDAILKLTLESTESIRSELLEDVDSAGIVYEQAVTAEKQTNTEAEADYKMNVLYESYSQSVYNETVQGLQDTVTEKQETLEEKQKELEEVRTELAEKEALLAEEKQVLENAIYTAEGTDQEENLYWWIVAWQTKQEAETLVEELEEEIEQLREEIKQYTEDIEYESLQLTLAYKALEIGVIQAQAEMDIQNYKAQNAQEIYEVTTQQSSFDVELAKEDYEEALEKLEEFDSVITDQVIKAENSGLVTEVSVEAGDTLTQNMNIISLNDYESVTITLSVEEDDMEAAAPGNQVNVTVAAFPEEVFKGKVTEIGDAQIDSNTNKTIYSVTVTVENIGDLLYQDMTADVTFVTEQTEEVLYIPNRAITTENETSYVLVKTEDGSIETRQVVTGFSDGVYTEIKEGLSQGETVIWESKVNKA